MASNHCSIKLLKNAYIGAGVRMTKGAGTVPFENKPMSGLLIEKYSKLGFRISHPDLPKTIWVDFDQLPLTRLQIDNGIIKDEITFVENIVLHKMQLIRTLDTEYVELLYQEKELEKTKDDIVPLSAATVGAWYKGAQCKDGLEMVYLGTWYTKNVSYHYDHYGNNYYHRDGGTKKRTFHLYKESPQRAFFAVKEGDKWDVINFPVTNKKVKEVISLHKSEELFSDRETNKEIILVSENDVQPRDNEKYSLDEERIALNENYPKPEIYEQLKLTSGYASAPQYLSDMRENIDVEAYAFLNKNFRLEMDKRYYSGCGYWKPSAEEIKGI